MGVNKEGHSALTCDYTMQLVGKRTKQPFVAWHCGLEAGHEGWHQAREHRTEIVDNYFREELIEEGPGLAPAEVLDREWLTPDDLSARTKLGKLARKLENEGWEVHVGRSIFFTGDTLVKSTGNVKPGKTETWVWIEAVHYRTERHLTANADGIIVNGKTVVEEAL